MRKAVLHPTVHLYLPRKPAAFAAACKDKLDAIDKSPDFPNAGPVVAVARKALGAYQDAVDAARTDRSQIKLRDDLKAPLKAAMFQILAHVQGVVDADVERAATIAASAGAKLRKVRTYHKPAFAAYDSELSGAVDLAVKAVKNAVSYYWQVSSDEVHWSSAPESHKTKTTISGLTPGQTYYFRFRTLTTKGMTDYSAPISHMVR